MEEQRDGVIDWAKEGEKRGGENGIDGLREGKE